MPADDDERMRETEEGLKAAGFTTEEPGAGKHTGNGADRDSNRNFGPNTDYEPPDGSKKSAEDKGGADALELLNFREYRAQFKSMEQMAIEGLSRFGTVISVNARPSAGKTALLIHISQCLSSGTAFLGRETEQCVVAYIATEDMDDVVNRLEAVNNEHLMIVKSSHGLPLAKPARARKIVLEVIRQARLRYPFLPVFIVIDTLRSALGDQSVMDDRHVSPALNAMREVAEQEKALIAIANHTNRENPKQTKGETLETVVATELILAQGDDGWFNIFVGKNRCGPSHKKIGKVRYTSVKVGGVQASIIDKIVADEASTNQKEPHGYGKNQRLVLQIVGNLVVDAPPTYPYGAGGPCVKAVKEAAVRDDFVKRMAGHDRPSKVKKFTATLQSLLDRQDLVRSENASEEGVLWFRAKEAENSPHKWDGEED